MVPRDTGTAHLWSLLAGKKKLRVLYFVVEERKGRGCWGDGNREGKGVSCVAWRLLPSIRSGFIWESAVFVLAEVDMCIYPVLRRGDER